MSPASTNQLTNRPGGGAGLTVRPPASAMGTVVVDGHIYVCGGYDGKSSLNSVERYSPETDR